MFEKCYELNLDLYMLFTDFKQVYDSINGAYFHEIIKEFGITKKLVNLMKMIWNSNRKVKIQRQLTEVIWCKKRLETRRCTVYSTVQNCSEEGDNE
jgi:hypothetical protein